MNIVVELKEYLVIFFNLMVVEKIVSVWIKVCFEVVEKLGM